MNYKIFVYVIVVLATTFAVSGTNINFIFKKNHVWEARIFVFLLIVAISELVSSFIFNFLEAS